MSEKSIWSPLAEGQLPKVYLPGELIYLQGTEGLAFYYVMKGTVKCFISSEAGVERILAFHRDGELIGEAAFFDKLPRISSAVALTACTLVRVNREHLSQVFSRCPDLAISMLEYLARTVRLLSAHVDGNFLPANRRIAQHLLSLPRDKDGACRCTHEEIGACVGANRVTVSRALRAFSACNWIQTGYRSVTLLDFAALRAFACGERQDK